jgi:hypothetical protein
MTAVTAAAVRRLSRRPDGGAFIGEIAARLAADAVSVSEERAPRLGRRRDPKDAREGEEQADEADRDTTALRAVARALGSFTEELGALVRASHDDEHSLSARHEVLRPTLEAGPAGRDTRRKRAFPGVSAVRGRWETRVALVSATRAVAIVAVRSPNTLSGEIVVSDGEKASNGVTQENRPHEHRLTPAAHDGTCHARRRIKSAGAHFFANPSATFFRSDRA